jgi:pyruvate dehydrogenase E2 component (dihydrolipoamide acetyltransferase)
MPYEIRVPRLGWSMEEGVFLRWLKNNGDRVQPGDPLYELESDKATQEIEAADAGVLQIFRGGPEPGAVVPVGALLGRLVTAEEAAGGAAVSIPAPARKEQFSSKDEEPSKTIAASPPPIHERSRHRASPRARRVATELGVDWTRLNGTGKGGRVREADVRAFRRSCARDAALSPRPERIVPVSPRRRTIAAHMLESARTTAPVTLTARADATNLVGLRSHFKATLSPHLAPTYTDFAIYLVARVLQRYPLLAARWDEDRIILPEDDCPICMAVDTEAGLVAPVLRGVSHTSLLQLAKRSRELVDRARIGKLTVEELEGGVFTVTNLGAYGVDAFTPIINSPQTAILGLGAIRREAVILEDDRVAARERITLSLTFDHRVIDGVPAARFLHDFCSTLANPSAHVRAEVALPD